jgi:sulfite reductase beta subunit-like hemoprotein
MSKASVEDIKLASAGLRGQLAEQFADTSTPNIPEDSNILLKHHGSYQQDDRDVRAERTKEEGKGLELHDPQQDARRPHHRQAVDDP